MTPMTLEVALEVAIDAAGSWQSYGDPNEEPREGVGEAIAVLRSFLEKGLPFYRAAEEYAAWCDTSRRKIAEIDTSKTFAWINQLGEKQHLMRAAYRAMKEG